MAPKISLPIIVLLFLLLLITNRPTKKTEDEIKNDSPNNNLNKTNEMKIHSELSQPKKLVLIVRSGLNNMRTRVAKSTIIENFISAMEITGCKSDGVPIIKAISQSVYRDLNKIILGKSIENCDILLKNKIKLSQLKINDLEYLLVEVPSGMSVQELDIEMIGPSELSGKYTPYSNSINKKMSQLSLSPLIYSIPWEDQCDILRVSTKTLIKNSNRIIIDIDDCENHAQQRYYSIVAENFVGSLSKIIQIMQDPEKFEDVIQIDANITPEAEINIASMWLPVQKTMIQLNQDNNLTFTIPQNSKGTTSKAWIKFPLTESEAIEQCAKINACETTGQAYKVFSEIEHKVKVNETSEVTPEKRAQWFELSPSGENTSFSRTLLLKDLDGMMKQYSKYYIVVVRERVLSSKRELIRCPNLSNIEHLSQLEDIIRDRTNAMPENNANRQ